MFVIINKKKLQNMQKKIKDQALQIELLTPVRDSRGRYAEKPKKTC